MNPALKKGLAIIAVVQQERRRLGIYEVPVYVAKVHATGQFDLESPIARLTSDTSVRINLGQARLLIPIDDFRGVRKVDDSVAALTQSATGTSMQPGRHWI